MLRPYPDLSKSELPDPPKRKDALVPEPREFDLSDPDATKAACQTAEGRIALFERMVNAESAEKSN